MIFTRLIPFDAFDELASDEAASLIEDFGPGVVTFLNGSVGDAICDLLRAQIGTFHKNGTMLADLTVDGAEDGIMLTATVDDGFSSEGPTSNFRLTGFTE